MPQLFPTWMYLALYQAGLWDTCHKVAWLAWWRTAVWLSRHINLLLLRLTRYRSVLSGWETRNMYQWCMLSLWCIRKQSQAANLKTNTMHFLLVLRLKSVTRTRHNPLRFLIMCDKRQLIIYLQDKILSEVNFRGDGPVSLHSITS